MARQLLVQMSGCPGAGKTTIARAISKRKSALILDHDVLKSALMGTGILYSRAGAIAYEMAPTLIRSFLDQGLSVVIDSPCYYDQILLRGLSLARETEAFYRYIECVTDDLDRIDERLRNRVPLRSQRRSLTTPSPHMETAETKTGEPLFREWIAHMKRPDHSYLRVDTAQPLEKCLEQVFAFLDEH